ncbi:MAG: hypothetical protein AAB932_00270 [Patescibacteria group bacterium]
MTRISIAAALVLSLFAVACIDDPQLREGEMEGFKTFTVEECVLLHNSHEDYADCADNYRDGCEAVRLVVDGDIDSSLFLAAVIVTQVWSIPQSDLLMHSGASAHEGNRHTYFVQWDGNLPQRDDIMFFLYDARDNRLVETSLYYNPRNCQRAEARFEEIRVTVTPPEGG